MSIYRWAKLDDQSGPDRSIELTSISGWAGKKPSQEGLVFGSVARLPLVGPEHQWVGRQKPKAISNTHTERRILEQSTQVVSSSISGSLTIGNESPFQAHSVLESSSDFRLILRLENAPQRPSSQSDTLSSYEAPSHLPPIAPHARPGALPARQEAVGARNRSHLLRARHQRTEQPPECLLGQKTAARRRSRDRAHRARARLIRLARDHDQRGISRLGRPALQRAMRQSHAGRRHPRPGARLRFPRNPRRHTGDPHQGYPLRACRRSALPGLPALGDRREALRYPQSDQPARDGRKRAVRRMVRARGRGLPAELSDRALGGRNAAPSRAGRARQEGARKPPRQYQPSGQSMVRAGLSGSRG